MPYPRWPMARALMWMGIEMTAPAASQAAITRALAAATAAGLQVTRFAVARDGTVTVETAPKLVDSRTSNVQPITPKAWAKR